MKYVVQSACAAAALVCVSTQAYAAQYGVNYDPAHSSAFVQAQKSNDIAGMNRVMSNDLDQLKKMGFTIIKTFYSTFCTINGQSCTKIAEYLNARNMRVLLVIWN